MFLPLRDRIITRLETDNSWHVVAFSSILREYLSTAIRDNHFDVDGQRMGVNYYFLVPSITGERIIFERSENGIRNRATGFYVYEVLVGDELVSDVFRLSLNNAGELYYSLVYVISQQYTAPRTAKILYENGEADIFTLRFSLQRRDFGPVYMCREQGFPVVSIMIMGFPDSTYGMDSENARRFLAYAEELQDEPVVIIDVRSNMGGNGSLAPRFMHILTGELLRGNFYALRMQRYGAIGDTERVYESQTYTSAEISYIYWPSLSFDDNHVLAGSPATGVAKNDRLIILLTDRYTASSGDGFADLLFNMENTLIIGQNTAGVMITCMAFGGMTLPHSGIEFGFGTHKFIHPPGHLPEGIGITPDLWVNGNAVTAAVAFAEKWKQQ